MKNINIIIVGFLIFAIGLAFLLYGGLTRQPVAYSCPFTVAPNATTILAEDIASETFFGMLALGGLIALGLGLRNGASSNKLTTRAFMWIVGIAMLAVVAFLALALRGYGGSGTCGAQCIGAPGYYCQNPYLNTEGNLSFTLGQNIGLTIYNIQLACTATTTQNGSLNNATAWEAVAPDGNVGVNATDRAVPLGGWSNKTVAVPVGGLGNIGVFSLANMQTANIMNLTCFNQNGIPLMKAYGGDVPIGTIFSGFIWLNYTTLSNVTPGSAANPWHTVRMATITTTVR